MQGTDDRGAAVISRRDAIIGALALAAGTIVASAPDVAVAADGEAMHVGGVYTASSETKITRLGAGNLTDSDVSLNDLDFGAHFGVSAAVYGHALTGSAAVKAETHGEGQYAVRATAYSPNSTAVLAEANTTALRVVGVTKFSRSGKATISKGHKTATVSGLTKVGTDAIILVTLQGSAGATNYVRYAKRLSDTSFKVYLGKKAHSTVTFGWMILN